MPTRLGSPDSLTTLLTLAGCNTASVSESQCIASDWQTIGYRDGGRRSAEHTPTRPPSTPASNTGSFPAVRST